MEPMEPQQQFQQQLQPEQRRSFFKGINYDAVENKWRARITRKAVGTVDLKRCARADGWPRSGAGPSRTISSACEP
jgi:hypothetical protein